MQTSVSPKGSKNRGVPRINGINQFASICNPRNQQERKYQLRLLQEKNRFRNMSIRNNDRNADISYQRPTQATTSYSRARVTNNQTQPISMPVSQQRSREREGGDQIDSYRSNNYRSPRTAANTIRPQHHTTLNSPPQTDNQSWVKPNTPAPIQKIVPKRSPREFQFPNLQDVGKIVKSENYPKVKSQSLARRPRRTSNPPTIQDEQSK